jgi:hypothetical protein
MHRLRELNLKIPLYAPWPATSDTMQASGTSQVLGDSIDALIGNLKDEGLLE